MSENARRNFILPVAVTSVLFALLGFLLPELLISIHYPILGILVLTIGLPHGATDYLLFKRMNGSNLSRAQILKFFAIYITAVLGFLALWIILAKFSFIIFILISSYHFGQSNWGHISLSKFYNYAVNLIWGLFAIGGSVLWHWQESKIIISQVVGELPEISQEYMDNIQLSIIILNVASIFLLWTTNRIRTNRQMEEFGKLAILSCMFYFTPMLVGFVLYFTLWHS
jgi:beta-carotene 15,15'-dioxygenase